MTAERLPIEDCGLGIVTPIDEGRVRVRDCQADGPTVLYRATMRKKKGEVHFVVDGRVRIILAERARIKREVRAKYADELAAAGFWGRLKIRRRIRREIRNELEKIAPRNALYMRSGQGGFPRGQP